MANALEKDIVIITGASSGIGKQCAITCSENGAKCILIGRNIERLKHTFDSLQGTDHLYFSVDVNDSEAIEKNITDSVSDLGKISGFIHAAGIEITKPFKMHSIDDFETQIRTNALSSFEIMKLISKKKNLSINGASFIVISSVMGHLGQPGQIGYCASKSILNSTIKGIALELGAKKIRVNTISPGLVLDTDMAKNFLNGIPEKSKLELEERHVLGMISSDDIANACVFLLSDLSKRITGTDLLIDSGYCAK